MSKTRTDVLNESKRKGITAGALTAATVTAAVAVGPITAVILAVPSAIYGYRWWKHRSENGIRF